MTRTCACVCVSLCVRTCGLTAGGLCVCAVVFEESIAHKGSPFRIALSREGEDEYESCILLDHIPHNDANSPVFGVESTYTKTYVTITIPDVQCTRCSLQLVNPMTDKLAGAGMANCTYDATCTNCPDKPGTCFSVYHSCANVRINGRTPRAQFTCPSQPATWPYGNLTTSFYYIGEVGEFSADGEWLANVPAEYTTPVGRCV
jgi:hypothetical protein